MKVKSLSRVRLLGTPWTAACEASLSITNSQSLLKLMSILLLLLLSRFSRVRLCATPQRAAHQAPLSLGFSRQEYWSGLHFALQRIFLTQASNLYLLGLLHWLGEVS